MSVEKLKDIMETKYIINALYKRFTDVMEYAVENKVVIDLADCKFGPICAGKLRSYYDKVDFINSTDKVLDNILKHNMESVRLKDDEGEYIEFLFNKNDEDVILDEVIVLINQLPRNLKFKVNISLVNIKQRAALILLILARPDLEFDIRQCSDDIYRLVRDTWLNNPYRANHNSYLELRGKDTVQVDKQEDGKFHIDNEKYDELRLVENRLVIPVEFGSSQIVKLDGSGVPDEWSNTVETLLDLLEREEDKKKRLPGKILKNYLKTREEILK